MLSFSRREEPGHGYIQIIGNQRPASDPKGSLSAMTSLALLFTAHATSLSSTLRLTLRYMGSTLTQSLLGTLPLPHGAKPQLSLWILAFYCNNGFSFTNGLSWPFPLASLDCSSNQPPSMRLTLPSSASSTTCAPAGPQFLWDPRKPFFRRFCLKDAGLNHKWYYSSMWWVPIVPAKQIFQYGGSGLLIITTNSSTPVDQNHRLLTRNSKQPW